MMKELRESDIKLLEVFSCALSCKNPDWTTMPENAVWQRIYRDAQEHKIFPMVMEAISGCALFSEDPTVQKRYRFFLKRFESEILTQAQRTADFLLLYDFLLKKSLKPLAMKGIVCRSLYPEPEHRPSSDEDLLIDPNDFNAYHQAMLDYGMQLVDPDEDIEKAYEVAYHNEETLLYIELHKYMFPPGSQIFGPWNDLFERKGDHCSQIRVYGRTLYTLNPTDHLVYLILHAFKHFLHGGFGIRQVADIVLFSEVYADQIDWEPVKEKLCSVHAKEFVRAIYKIASRYLWKDLAEDVLFPGWDFSEIDEFPLLLDVMESGVYGASTLTRNHSSNMTLYAMRQRDATENSYISAMLHAVFLPRKSLEKSYPYLKKAPYMLPLAWTQRVMHYLQESKKHYLMTRKQDYIKKSVKLGKERIELLRQYNIIEK